MAIDTYETDSLNSSIQVGYDTAIMENVSIVLDLDMRTGSLPGETGWLSGAGAAAGTYPGDALAAFNATNTDTTNVSGGSLRMVTVKFDLKGTSASALEFKGNLQTGAKTNPAPISKIVALLGFVHGSAEHDTMAKVTVSGSTVSVKGLAAMDDNYVTVLLA